MINANELRVGNWIGLNLKEFPDNYFKVSEVGQTMKLETEYYDIRDCNHIPLTPEILLKAGFMKNRNGEPCIEINDMASHLELMVGVDNWHYPSFTQTPQGSEERTVYFNRINSLHQLQNLIFALTGIELEIKPQGVNKSRGIGE